MWCLAIQSRSIFVQLKGGTFEKISEPPITILSLVGR